MNIQGKIKVLDYDRLVKKEGFGWIGSLSGKVAATRAGNFILKKAIQNLLVKYGIDVIVEDVILEKTGDIYDLNIVISDASYPSLVKSLYAMVKSGKIKVADELSDFIVRYEDSLDVVIGAVASMPKEAYMEMVNYADRFSGGIADMLNDKLQTENGEVVAEVLEVSLYARS